MKFTDGSVLLNISSSFDESDPTEKYLAALNRRPQIVLGIVSGEDILSTSTAEYQEKLRTISESFREYAERTQHAVVSTTIVFGGASPQDLDACLWVDIEGQGPAVPDVLSRVAAMMYKQLPNFMQDLRGQLLQSQQNHDTGSSGIDGRVSLSNGDSGYTLNNQSQPFGTQVLLTSEHAQY